MTSTLRLRLPPLVEFARALVEGVAEQRDQIDVLLDQRSEHWRISRMAATDRAVLRLAVYELAHSETPGAVIVGLLYAYLPLVILPVYASIERLDRQLLEAASNLGASRIRTFFDVTLPLTLPGTMIGAIFVFVPSMGNFVVPELLGGGKTVMVGNLIRDQFLEARDWPFGAVIALFVVALLVALFAIQAAISRRINGKQVQRV